MRFESGWCRLASDRLFQAGWRRSASRLAPLTELGEDLRPAGCNRGQLPKGVPGGVQCSAPLGGEGRMARVAQVEVGARCAFPPYSGASRGKHVARERQRVRVGEEEGGTGRREEEERQRREKEEKRRGGEEERGTLLSREKGSTMQKIETDPRVKKIDPRGNTPYGRLCY